MSHRLTIRRLEAIVEALTARTAGEIDVEDDGAPTREDYDEAMDWALAEIGRRRDRQTRSRVLSPEESR
ncbi:hypothetical protein HFO56_23210 [Rhizobium laguerreae]|uniref:hypothetical protein n=1 Tax=Rhizobium laguerreae TaxID=1076926 RepID=UPI001C91A767|nr:hypothetical protein [Rhizobium laguerreae]MBY3155235.1 hypothetical protein [Rhizobium laguerreae]MBY3432717.1 hypothetical protein [Rhizobium laguerreae]